MIKHRKPETVREREPQFSKIGLICVRKIKNGEIGKVN